MIKRHITSDSSDGVESARTLLREKRLHLESMIRKLQDDVETIRKAENILAASVTQSNLFPGKSYELSASLASRFADSSMTEAILTVLRDKKESWLDPVSVTEEVRSGGLKSDAKNLHQAIAATLIRLVREGKIDRQKDDSKRKSLYRIKQIS